MGILDQGGSRFRYALQYSLTKNNEDRTTSTSFGINYTATGWLFMEAQVPMINNYYDNLGDPYEVTGLGDVRLTATVNLSTTLFGYGEEKTDDKESKKEKLNPNEEKEEDEAGSSFPNFTAGLGLKFPTGSTDNKDVPIAKPYQQAGTGALDTSFTLQYFQVLGDFTPFASLSYTMPGEGVEVNGVLYEKGDSMSVAVGTRFLVDKTYAGNIVLSFSMTNNIQDDTWFNGTSLNTAGVFTYYQIGYTMSPLKRLDMNISLQNSLTSPKTSDGSTSASMDYSLSFGIGYRF